MYKLRIYKKNGMLDHEEYYFLFSAAVKRYNELFNYYHFSLNPTLWEQDEYLEWIRVHGF